MQQNKKNFIEKIVKKDYNNQLEKILEDKQFSEDVKSTLLSILYKIEVAYKDLKIVKNDIEDKDEYISNILEIIEKDCNLITIIKMSDDNGKIPDNKTFVIDKDKKEIVAYPIERKLLYAISKIAKKDRIIKDEYFLINQTLSNLINVGNNINMVEPLRDFNGFSWTNIPQEIESVDHNLVYQNLRILVGYKFLDKWVKNTEFIIDYFELFKEKIESSYGEKFKNQVIDLLSRISILLSIKFKDIDIDDMLKLKENVENEFQKIQNRQQFVEETTKRKFEIEECIKEIDTVINNKELLQSEYKKRNDDLPLESKIFSMRVLAKMMNKERENYLKDLDMLNTILNPTNFIKYKKELEEKHRYLEVFDVDDKEKELDKLKIQLQRLFLDMIKININKAETKQEIEKIIYDFRYYLLLPFDYKNDIRNKEKLKKQINQVIQLLIDKAINFKIIEKVSSNDKVNYEILKNIFYVRIIKLEDAYLKIIEEKGKFFLQLFDENIFEEKVQISKPEGLEIKKNKKVSVWI